MAESTQQAGAGVRPARIGVTGGIACGKSLVGRCLEALGIEVLDADDVCHRLLEPGGEVAESVRAEFGPEAVGAGPAIDRGALGRRVFADPQARSRLNALLHPPARRAVDAWLAEHPPRRGAGGARWLPGGVALVPLVYEAGWTDVFECLICVAAPAALQRERLRRNGLSEREANQRIAAQWPVEEKMNRADYVIFNAGTEACVRQQTLWVVERISAQMESGHGR